MSNAKKTVILLVIFLALALILKNSYAQGSTKLVDGYILNVTGDEFPNTNVTLTVGGGCVGSACSGNYTSEADGYYIIGNLDCSSGSWPIRVDVNYPGGWFGYSTTVCGDATSPIHLNVTIGRAPSAPILVPQGDIHDTNVSLSWTSNATRSEKDPDGDNVYDYFRFGSDYNYSSSISSPREITGLTPETTYTWGVRSCDKWGFCSGGIYDPTNTSTLGFVTSSFSVINNPPSISLIDVPHTQSTTITFSWTNTSDPEGDTPIHIEFKLYADSVLIEDEDNLTGTSYTVSSLSTFTYYTWEARICDEYGGFGNGACSDWENDTFFIYSCPACPPSGGGGSTYCPPCVCEGTFCPISPEEVCYSDWRCSQWSSCTAEGLSYRSCTDNNNCKITVNQMPSLVQSCIYTPTVCPEPDIAFLEKEVILEMPAVIKEIEKIFKKPEADIITSITDENTRISSIGSCDASWLKRVEFVDETDFNIPAGKTIINQPFKVDCLDNQALLTVAIPDKYADVKALKCYGKDDCQEIFIRKLYEIDCDIGVLEQAYSTTVDLGSIRIIPARTSLISSTNNRIISGDYSVLFNNVNENINVILRTGSELAPQNPSLRMISAQLELKFEKILENSIEIEIELPYVKQNIDENSIGIYIKDFKKGAAEWIYLGGELNKKTRRVKIKIQNTNNFLSSDFRLVFAVIAPVCIACEGVEFINVYNPIPLTKDAVVMIHGLGSSPATFSSLINDIKITNQPWQIWTYGYPTDEEFLSIARRFANKLEENINNFDNLYLVAHSLGGLVTQRALRYAYEQNIAKPGTYTFVSKVKKVILIGTPNKGSPGAEVYQNLFSEAASGEDAVENLVNLNNPIMDLLLNGENIPRVPGIDYLTIAGTKPYELFSQRIFQQGVVNDGVVSTDSATFVGGDYVNNLCKDYWEIGTTHTDLLKNPVSRKVIAQIVAKQIAEVIGHESMMGLISYYELDDSSCDADSTYIFVGREMPKQLQYDETGCACGDGYCGDGENELNCPSDCAEFFREENICVMMLFIIMLSSILFAVFLVIAVNKMYSIIDFSNIAIVPMVFIITSLAAMMSFVIRGCYVEWVYKTLTIIISVFAIATGVVLVSVIVVKNKIRMHLATLKRKDEIKKLETYVFKMFEINEEKIKRKLIRVGWKKEDISGAIKKAKKNKLKKKINN